MKFAVYSTGAASPYTNHRIRRPLQYFEQNMTDTTTQKNFAFPYQFISFALQIQ